MSSAEAPAARDEALTRQREVTMLRARLIAVASIVVVTAVPATDYFISQPSSDPLSQRMRDYNFFPLRPPSNLMDVGSLYYVSPDVSDFKQICAAEKADVDGAVSESRSWQIQEDLNQSGNLAMNVEVRFVTLLTGKVRDNYVQKTHYSLTDVLLDEIQLGSSGVIYRKLMNKPECSQEAMKELQAGGYVCQLQEILRASAEIRLDRDTQRELQTRAAAVSGETRESVKTTIATQGVETRAEQENGSYIGPALTYGVAMNPTCIAPEDARFPRILPRTRLDRVVNFVLYHIIEPLFPAKREPVDVAQGVHAEAR
jgi:hypothetical protein